jgi:hypothetical protein
MTTKWEGWFAMEKEVKETKQSHRFIYLQRREIDASTETRSLLRRETCRRRMRDMRRERE